MLICFQNIQATKNCCITEKKEYLHVKKFEGDNTMSATIETLKSVKSS